MMNDANAFAAALAAARMGWMTGQLAEVALPEFDTLDAKETQLRLLALDAQFRALTGAPVVSPDPVIAPAMPAVSRHPMPETARAWFQRIWREEQQNGKIKLLRLLDQRGYVAHPFDFIPQAHWDGLPDAYEPLLEWSRQATGGTAVPDGDDTYRTYSGAETRRHFSEQYSQDRAAAITWLEAELSQGNAQQRLRLLGDVAPYFTGHDEAFLRKLHQEDRSGKVKSLMVQILRRNGCKTDAPEDLSALDYLEQSKSGLLRRKRRISTVAKINQTRVNLLVALLAQIGLPELASHFDCTSAEFLEAWHWDKAHPDVTTALQRCVFETGQDADCLTLVRHYADQPWTLSYLDAGHMTRFSPAVQGDIITAFIDGIPKREAGLWHMVGCLADWRLLPLSAAQSDALWKRAQKHVDLNPRGTQDDTGFGNYTAELLDLAMCLNAPQAQAVLDMLVKKGVHSADPSLAPLHLNVALPDISQEGP